MEEGLGGGDGGGARIRRGGAGMAAEEWVCDEGAAIGSEQGSLVLERMLQGGNICAR